MPKTWLEETEQVSEPDANTAEMLELSDWEFKRTMIDRVRAPMGKGTICKNRWIM